MNEEDRLLAHEVPLLTDYFQTKWQRFVHFFHTKWHRLTIFFRTKWQRLKIYFGWTSPSDSLPIIATAELETIVVDLDTRMDAIRIASKILAYDDPTIWGVLTAVSSKAKEGLLGNILLREDEFLLGKILYDANFNIAPEIYIKREVIEFVGSNSIPREYRKYTSLLNNSSLRIYVNHKLANKDQQDPQVVMHGDIISIGHNDGRLSYVYRDTNNSISGEPSKYEGEADGRVAPQQYDNTIQQKDQTSELSSAMSALEKRTEIFIDTIRVLTGAFRRSTRQQFMSRQRRKRRAKKVASEEVEKNDVEDELSL